MFHLSVTRPLMSGKEASVFLVETRDGACVAKVYKDAKNRSFRQRADYTEGRTVRNTRQARAMAKGSKYGKALLEAEWQQAEVSALYRLHAAGVRVPSPYHYSDNVLLMELITDSEGHPAPRLWDVRLRPDEARTLHTHLVRQCGTRTARACSCDLSEYNIPMSGEGPVIIDLPQATDAAHNRNSERLFLRDLKNSAGIAPSLKKTQYGQEIWALYESGQLQPDSPLTGRFKQKRQRTDAESVIAEIQAAAAEAGEKPMSAYQRKKLAKAAEQDKAQEEAIARARARAEAAKHKKPKSGDEAGEKVPTTA